MSGIKKRKPYTHLACQTCKDKHLKCDGARPNCGNCSLKRIDCLYREERNRKKDSVGSGGSGKEEELRDVMVGLEHELARWKAHYFMLKEVATSFNLPVLEDFQGFVKEEMGFGELKQERRRVDGNPFGIELPIDPAYMFQEQGIPPHLKGFELHRPGLPMPPNAGYDPSIFLEGKPMINQSLPPDYHPVLFDRFNAVIPTFPPNHPHHLFGTAILDAKPTTDPALDVENLPAFQPILGQADMNFHKKEDEYSDLRAKSDKPESAFSVSQYSIPQTAIIHQPKHGQPPPPSPPGPARIKSDEPRQVNQNQPEPLHLLPDSDTQNSEQTVSHSGPTPLQIPISQPSTTPIPIPIPVPLSSQTPATIPIPIPTSNPLPFHSVYPSYSYVSPPQAHLLSPIRRPSDQKNSPFLTVPPQTISPQKIPQTIPPPLTVPPISAQIVSLPIKPINATISTPPAPHQPNQTPSPPQPLVNSACLAQPVAISPNSVFQANIMHNMEGQNGASNSSPHNIQNASAWNEGQGLEMKNSVNLQNIELQKQILMENQQNNLQGMASAQERSFKREREEEEQEYHRVHKEFQQQYPEPIEQEKSNMSLIQ